jgi:hypothetical protein
MRILPRRRGLAGLALAAGCGGGGAGAGEITTMGDESTEGDSGASEEGTDDGATPDVGGAECEAWPWTWIGGPCEHDDDCAYEGGLCLLEAEGFPCGTCSQPCEQYCPDLDGAPTTFCVDSGDLELAPPEGLCLSQCAPEILGGDGCRPGYACVPLGRWGEPGAVENVCVPEGLAPQPADCLAELDAMGLAWEPAAFVPEHPEGRPDLTCTIEDPVYLHSPVGGVSVRYSGSMDEGPVLVACQTALAIARTAEILEAMNAVELVHLGTYNCRVIAGTDELSTHGLGLAIDLAGFTLADDTVYTVYDDFEDGVDMPVTPGGQWLLQLAVTLFAEEVWNIILTPNYNAAHDDHFHVDLTPGAHFYE